MKKSWYRHISAAAALALALAAAPVQARVQQVQAADLLDKIVTAPNNAVKNFAVTASTVDSVTLTWTKSADAETYYLSYWESAKPSTKVDVDDIGSVSEYKITNLRQAKYRFQITPANKLHSGIPLKGESVYIDGAPNPTEPSGVKINSAKAGYCSLYIEGLEPIYKSEVQLLDALGNPLEIYDGGEATGASIEDAQIKNNAFYAVRVRGYYDQPGGCQSCSDWTEPYYFATKFKSVKVSQKDKKAVLSWTPVTGAKNYKIYISKKSSGGFKKIATTTNSTASVAKYEGMKLSAKKTYYFKVVASMVRDGEVYTMSSAVSKLKIK